MGILTSRERSDMEVLFRLFGIENVIYANEYDTFIARQKGKLCNFIELNPEDFPSLERKSYDIRTLLRYGD